MHPLRRFRLDRRLSLADFAAISGVSKTSLSRIETGHQQTTEATIRALMTATGGALTANDFIAAITPVTDLGRDRPPEGAR